MATKTTNKVILPGDGTDQRQRIIDALDPNTLKLHNLSVDDWMRFAWHFAEEVNYFNASNQIDGNWQDFFIEEPKIKAFLYGLETDQSLTPHLTLFVCFLKLLDISHDHFNQLSKSHLDFYYQKILKIEKQLPVPDKVHVIFELAKNVLQEKIDNNTALDAGKDSNGNKLNFNTQEEIIANKAILSQLKNVYHHSETNLKGIKACEVANSLDGYGKALPADNMKWFPFGYMKQEYTETNPELPDARLGFAVASPVLLLKEGVRTIDLKMVFQDSFSTLLAIQADTCVSVFLSGEKKWLGPFSLKTSTEDSLSDLKNEMNFKIELDKKVEAVCGYNQTVLGESFSSVDPVMRFMIDTSSEQGYSFVTTFSTKKLNNVTLTVDVKEMIDIDIENDLGVLNSKKPFMPFGPIPLKGSNFTFKNEEIFKKDWDQLVVNINWMNTPDSFKIQYLAYRTDFLKKITQEDYKNKLGKDLKNSAEYDLNAANLIVTGDDYFKVSVKIFSRNNWVSAGEKFDNAILFVQSNEVYKSQFTVSNDDNEFETSDNGQLRINLKQSFLHEMYPQIYAMAMLNDKFTLIPKEPYTPLIESINIRYSAKANVTFEEITKESYLGNKIKLFHEHPFGQSEEHGYLKPKAVFADSPTIYLLHDYQPGGELYLGMKDAEPLQQVSILFQIFEGSENPKAIGFAEDEKMEWSVLCSNNWMPLTSNYLISNNTDNFLKSGIVKFSIPAEATNDNTLLPPKLFWVRVKMNKKFDAVCKIIDIRAQAVVAQFEDKGNELSHLKNGLPANTISKLIERKQAVKTVSQPFSSFDGLPAETDLAYYQRISERLRHKNRAITLWDYEHLILQQFPEIHKVRCLNHTLGTSFLSPGNVLIVVIPDILNKNVFDIYQPRVSKATLNKVQNYINQLNTLHVNAVVINPEYEEVEISLNAKFYPGFDENYYKKVLQEDLTKLLSPWAFEKTVDLQFSTTLHKSVIINYIEKLQYVDFVTDLKVTHKGEIKPSVTPSNLKAILVSAKEHQIGILSSGCTKK
jgi:hypothetical protein